jgi:hypothetical protein
MVYTTPSLKSKPWWTSHHWPVRLRVARSRHIMRALEKKPFRVGSYPALISLLVVTIALSVAGVLGVQRVAFFHPLVHIKVGVIPLVVLLLVPSYVPLLIVTTQVVLAKYRNTLSQQLRTATIPKCIARDLPAVWMLALTGTEKIRGPVDPSNFLDTSMLSALITHMHPVSPSAVYPHNAKAALDVLSAIDPYDPLTQVLATFLHRSSPSPASSAYFSPTQARWAERFSSKHLRHLKWDHDAPLLARAYLQLSADPVLAAFALDLGKSLLSSGVATGPAELDNFVETVKRASLITK